MFKRILKLLPTEIINSIANDGFSVLKDRREISTWIVGMGDKYAVEFGVRYKVRLNRGERCKLPKINSSGLFSMVFG